MVVMPFFGFWCNFYSWVAAQTTTNHKKYQKDAKRTLEGSELDGIFQDRFFGALTDTLVKIDESAEALSLEACES